MSTCRHDVAGSSKILVWTSTWTSRSPARLWLRAMSRDGWVDPASMGPHPFRRGNGHRRGQGQRIHRLASMGPHPFRRGNEYKEDTGKYAYQLQWGHTLSGVETASVPRIALRLVHFVSLVNYVSICSTSWRVHFHCRRSHPGPDRFRKVRELRTYECHHRTARNQVWATLGSCSRVTVGSVHGTVDLAPQALPMLRCNRNPPVRFSCKRTKGTESANLGRINRLGTITAC